MSDFDREAYDRSVARRYLAATDLEELAQQVEDGEIDDSTAAGLRAGYEAELATAEAGIAKAGKPPTPKKTQPTRPASKPSNKRAPSEQGRPQPKGVNTRWLVGAGILVAALVVIIISVQNSSEPDPAAGGAIPGAADGGDPCAELANALSDHADNGFRLALADCYTDVGNAMSAIEQYRTVAESDSATDGEAARANVGLGFLNLQIGEVQSAADYMRVALETDPVNVEAQYFLGMMLIYDLGDPSGGVPYLESVLEAPDLPASVIEDVEAALAVARGDGASS